MNAMMNLNVTLPLGVVQPANGFSPPATSPPEGYKRQGSRFQEQGGDASPLYGPNQSGPCAWKQGMSRQQVWHPHTPDKKGRDVKQRQATKQTVTLHAGTWDPPQRSCFFQRHKFFSNFNFFLPQKCPFWYFRLIGFFFLAQRFLPG